MKPVYYCEKCKQNHQFESKIGQKHIDAISSKLKPIQQQKIQKTNNVSGTSLVGYLYGTSQKEIRDKLGEPSRYIEEFCFYDPQGEAVYDQLPEWDIKYGNTTITIYKRESDDAEWHIGGFSKWDTIPAVKKIFPNKKVSIY